MGLFSNWRSTVLSRPLDFDGFEKAWKGHVRAYVAFLDFEFWSKSIHCCCYCCCCCVLGWLALCSFLDTLVTVLIALVYYSV